MRVHSIFWWQPELRDIRLKFFTAMSAKYSISFLFLPISTSYFLRSRPILDHHLRCEYCSERGAIRNRLLFYWISLQDVRKLYVGIENSDLFASTFVWNLYTLVGLVICKLFGKKLIVWEEISVIRTGLLSAIKYTILRAIFKHIDAFFVTGKLQENILKELDVDHNKIFRANEYPGRIYLEARQQTIPGVPLDRKIILYIGRLVDWKGVDYLIKSFRLVEQEFDNVSLLIVGDGPFRTHLEALATTLRLTNVSFLGKVTEAEKTYLLAICTMVVAPTYITNRSSETMGPVSVLEALSAGKPAITTTVAGSSEFIQNGVNGFVVPEKDAKSLANKIKYLLENEIPSSQVLTSFRRIRGFDYQVEQFEKAINYVTQNE